MFTSPTQAVILANRTKMPCIGFGTWRAKDGQIAKDSVSHALKAGYRHIDTAAIYGNEASVGDGILESGIKREDIFLTTKHWTTERGYEKTVAALKESLRKLKTDYVDLYLIHWPCVEKTSESWAQINAETWSGFEALYKEGLCRAIGVSNFNNNHLSSLLQMCNIKPMVNQIEFHPGYPRNEEEEFCKENGIVLQAWSPLGSGAVLENEGLKLIAQKYEKSVAQLCIRYCLQSGYVVLPKSVTPKRIEENLKVFDFNLSVEDMQAIRGLTNLGYSGLDPAQAPAG